MRQNMRTRVALGWLLAGLVSFFCFSQARGEDSPKGGTYELRNKDTDQVMRTGRTKSLERRESQHSRLYPNLQFKIDMRTDKYEAQRGREQIIHDAHDPPLNKINPISPNNPRRDEYIKAAKQLSEQRSQRMYESVKSNSGSSSEQIRNVNRELQKTITGQTTYRPGAYPLQY